MISSFARWGLRWAAVVITIFAARTAWAQSGWSTVGGNPARNGLTLVAGPERAQLLWQGATLEATTGNQVFIDGNKLVTVRRVSNHYAPLVCHDLNSGALLWTKDLTGATALTLPVGFSEGVVYALRTQRRADTLYALHAADGTVKWRAPFPVKCAHTTSANFTPEGDLLVEGEDGLLVRLSRHDGRRLWATRCDPMAAGELSPTVSGGYAYVWEWQGYPQQAISMVDLHDGRKVSTTTVPHGSGERAFVQTPLTAGPDGTLYAYKPHDRVVALRRDSTRLRVLWERSVAGNAAFSHLACGPDGSLYLPHQGRILRLDGATGRPLDSTRVLVRNPATMTVRMATDVLGTLYASVAEFPDGTLYAFSPALRERWSQTVEGLHLSGPALGPQGQLVVAGNGRQLLAFRPSAPAGGRQQYNLTLLPSPVSAAARLNYSLTRPENVRIHLTDLAGRPMRTWEFPAQPPGNYEVLLEELDARNTGVFILTFETDSGEQVRRKVTR